MAVEMEQVPAPQAGSLISILGTTNMLGRLIYGLIGDHSNPVLAYGTGFLGAGAALIVMPVVHGFWALAAMSAVIGFFLASVPCLVSVASIHLFDICNLNIVTGCAYFSGGVGFFAGSSVLGYVYEASGHNYQLMMWIGSAIYFVAFLCVIICWRINLQCRAQNESRQENT